MAMPIMLEIIPKRAKRPSSSRKLSPMRKILKAGMVLVSGRGMIILSPHSAVITPSTRYPTPLVTNLILGFRKISKNLRNDVIELNSLEPLVIGSFLLHAHFGHQGEFFPATICRPRRVRISPNGEAYPGAGTGSAAGRARRSKINPYDCCLVEDRNWPRVMGSLESNNSSMDWDKVFIAR